MDINSVKINRISPQTNKFLQIIESIAKPPEKLYFRGILPELRIPTVAVVGSRKPTAYGREVSYKLSYDLAKYGIVVVSGLALGVDAIVHRAALDAGGTTIAVLANGVDKIRPATNHNLGEDILANGGAIISEYEPGTDGRTYQFLARNRIVSGLSDAVIVTEAAIRSGTLATVTFALEQGKEVFVVPGNITSPLSAGCNALIKQGALPITCAEDVLEIIAPQLLVNQTSLALGANPLESKIVDLIKSGVRDGDLLQAQAGASPSEFAQALTMMEIDGTIHSLGANKWTLR